MHIFSFSKHTGIWASLNPFLPTCRTSPHVSCHGHVVRTGAGIFGGVLVDARGREAHERTATVHTAALVAPVGTCGSGKVGVLRKAAASGGVCVSVSVRLQYQLAASGGGRR